MKAIYIYNPYSTKEVSLIERAKNEFGEMVTLVDVCLIPEFLRGFVRATPALIVVTDDLQGENLLSETVDGKLLVTAMLYKRAEEEDLAIHQQETNRLDLMIKEEQNKAIDQYTYDLLVGGII